jgi:hypothetical protein
MAVSWRYGCDSGNTWHVKRHGLAGSPSPLMARPFSSCSHGSMDEYFTLRADTGSVESVGNAIFLLVGGDYLDAGSYL